jgi:hypothetical protein
MNMDDILITKILPLVPRVISQIDRDLASPTYGAGERYYWKYKMHDYPNARFQESALLFSLLFNNDFPGNIYFNNKKLYSLIVAVAEFWAKIQRKNGSFDEIYPHENSFVATAFSTYAITETFIILKIKPSLDLTNAFLRAGNWLLDNNHPIVSNQMAGAALALHNLSQLLGDKKFAEGASAKLSILGSEFKKYGYYPEYGGFDIGYSTILLYFLTKLEAKGKNSLTEENKTAIHKIEQETDEYGRYDHKNKSRQTQYIFPYAFKYFKNRLYDNWLKGLEKDFVLQPGWMDDRFCLFLTINYLETFLLNKLYALESV